MSEKRVLPAKVYDALQLSAAMYGGIGGTNWFVSGALSARDRDAEVPVCYLGHLVCAGFQEPLIDGCYLDTKAFGISWDDNDMALEAINGRRGRQRDARVTFEEWCAELGVIRGDETPSPARGSAERSDAAPDSRALVSR